VFFLILQPARKTQNQSTEVSSDKAFQSTGIVTILLQQTSAFLKQLVFFKKELLIFNKNNNYNLL
jgi:hypothetical protein